MDFATGVGLLIGIAVVLTLILLGGRLSGCSTTSTPLIVIGGGCTAATMIRFPFSAHRARASRWGSSTPSPCAASHPRELIDEITKIAEVVRKNGPMALENVQVDDPFLAQGIRYIADGYDRDFIKDTMERDRDNLPASVSKRARRSTATSATAAPAWGMIGTLLGMVQMFANMSDPSKLGPFMAVVAAGDALRRARRQPALPAHRRQAAPQARGGGHLAHR